MVSPASTPRRVAAATVFATLMSVSAVCAHALAGGMVPTPTVVGGSTAAMFAVAWLLADRRRHVLVLTAVVIAGQLSLHVSYALSMASASRAAAVSMILCGQPHGHVMAHMAGMPQPMGMWSGGWMTAAHCVAATVMLLIARYGDDVASGIAACIRHHAYGPVSAPVLAVPAASWHVLVPRRRLRGVALCSGLGLRGPPITAS